MNATRQTQATAPTTIKSAPPAQTGLSQLKCACGGSAGVTGACSECSENRLSIQRATPDSGLENRNSAGEPRVAHEAPRSAGRPPDAAAAASGGPHSGHDFSKVRVHADGRAPENRTGMPGKLMTGLEQLSGFDLSDVRVHYNSTEPARLDALAYTQGTDIVLGPGQEKHLPHEGWHVVQQMQGRVKPTMQAKGALINDDEGLEREADTMGARAGALGEQSAAAGFHARIATAGGGGDDEPYVTALTPTAQGAARQFVKPGISAGSLPVVQRAASFVAGPVSATTNLASHLIAGNRDAGFTPPTLNGATIMSAAAAQAAIKPPTLGGQSRDDGTVDSWVNSVDTNTGSFTMQVPSAGPWSTLTTKVNVAALFTSLGLTAPAACSGAGDSTFSVNGKPTDADFAANVRTHENLHAADHESGFNTVILDWDTKLEAAKTAGTVFNGPTMADAEAALFTAMGGTPSAVATRQHNTWIALNNATHTGTTLATGAGATPSNPVADATCSTSSLDAT